MVRSMAVLDILTYPDARLKQPSLPVDSFDKNLTNFIHDLEQTMDAGPGGVGIAAPQVNKFLRIIIDRKSTRLNSSHTDISRMPSSA